MSDQVSTRWYVRPLAALLLLTFEYLALSVVFDALPLLRRDGAIAGLGRMGLVGPTVIAFGTALWVFGGRRIKAALSSRPDASAARRWAWVILHFACFVAFFVLTAILFGTDSFPEGPAWLWIALWFSAGLATGFSWLAVALGGVNLWRLVRELAIPLAIATLMAFFAVMAGLVTVRLWGSLADVTMYSVAWLLGEVISPIHFDPATAEIGTEAFVVTVAPVCSGYEGIGLILVFLSAYLVGFRKQFRFPNVLVIIPAAILLVWLINVVRIVSLIVVGHYVSEGIAIGGFHSKAGWVAFCGVALGAVWVTQHVRWFQADRSRRRRETTNPSAPFLLPLLAVVATALITGVFVDQFDYFYPLRVVVALLVLAWYRDDYAKGLREHLRGRPILSWHAIGVGVAVYVLWVAIAAWMLPTLTLDPPDGLFRLGGPLAFAWVVARIVGSVFTVPIVEELAFRGFLLRRVVDPEFTHVRYGEWHWPAVLLSSLAFAALHQQWIGGFVAGMLYAYAQKRRGLLSDAIVAHAVTNALIAVQVLMLGHWSLW